MPPCARPPLPPVDSNHSRLQSTSPRPIGAARCAAAQSEPARRRRERGTRRGAHRSAPRWSPARAAARFRCRAASAKTGRGGCSCDCRSRGPAAATARAISGRRSTLAPHWKKVAGAPYCASASRICGVLSLGPSSKVSASAAPVARPAPDGAPEHRRRPPAHGPRHEGGGGAGSGHGRQSVHELSIVRSRSGAHPHAGGFSGPLPVLVL